MAARPSSDPTSSLGSTPTRCRERGWAVLPLRVLALALPIACGDRPGSESRLCLEILHRRTPAARVLEVATQPEPRRTQIAYRIEGAPQTSQLECEFQEVETGGLRVRSVAVDGRPLVDAELAIIDASLFLDDLARTPPLSASPGVRADR